MLESLMKSEKRFAMFSCFPFKDYFHLLGFKTLLFEITVFAKLILYLIHPSLLLCQTTHKWIFAKMTELFSLCCLFH